MKQQWINQTEMFIDRMTHSIRRNENVRRKIKFWPDSDCR